MAQLLKSAEAEDLRRFEQLPVGVGDGGRDIRPHHGHDHQERYHDGHTVALDPDEQQDYERGDGGSFDDGEQRAEEIIQRLRERRDRAEQRAEHYAREAAERDPAQRAEAVERKFLGHAKLAKAAQHRQR